MKTALHIKLQELLKSGIQEYREKIKIDYYSSIPVLSVQGVDKKNHTLFFTIFGNHFYQISPDPNISELDKDMRKPYARSPSGTHIDLMIKIEQTDDESMFNVFVSTEKKYILMEQWNESSLQIMVEYPIVTGKLYCTQDKEIEKVEYEEDMSTSVIWEVQRLFCYWIKTSQFPAETIKLIGEHLMDHRWIIISRTNVKRIIY